jgi:hypothetical protein
MVTVARSFRSGARIAQRRIGRCRDRSGRWTFVGLRIAPGLAHIGIPLMSLFRAQRTTMFGLGSGAPKILKPLLAQFCGAGGVMDGAVAEPVLDCPGVVAGIGQRRSR